MHTFCLNRPESTTESTYEVLDGGSNIDCVASYNHGNVLNIDCGHISDRPPLRLSHRSLY